MISHIKGILVEKLPTLVVLDLTGIGYEINIPVTTFEKLPELGKKLHLFTYLHVREAVMQLYGFWSENDRSLFKHLISVSGVGPRLALGILSGVSAEKFILAVANNNLSVLTKISGVGKKTAQRLVIELKDKLAQSVDLISSPHMQTMTVVEEAITALVSLGYRQFEARKAVEKVAGSESSLPSVETLIKKALQTAVSKS